jgi:tetratricopeptide (TPR) repeat protein
MPILDELMPALKSVRGIRRFWYGRSEWFPRLVSEYQEADQTDTTLRFSKDSSVYTRLAKAATQLGENLIALEIASEGSQNLEAAFRQKFPEIVTAQQIDLARERAIALSRLGSIREAQNILRDLLAIRPEDDKSLSALGRTYKDLAEFPGPARKKFLERSRAYYLQAYAVNGEYYPAINACTLSLWLNDREAARRLAVEVKKLCLESLTSNPDDYWALASIAEAELVLSGDVGEITQPTFEYYQQFSQLMHQKRGWGDLSSTSEQAKRICESLDWHFGALKRIFGVPDVVIFSGHMVDAPGRDVPRFPAKFADAVAEQIRQTLESVDAQIGISSAACGSDLLFIDAMLAREADIQVVLPWRKEEFKKTSVLAGGQEWEQRFDRALEDATSVTFLSQQGAPSGNLGYVYCNDCMNGMALFRSEKLGSDVRPMAVWDGRRGDGLGGTSSFVDFWTSKGRPVEVIDLESITGAKPKDQKFDRISFGEITVSEGQQTIKTLLFADVVGYSKIPENQIKHFAPEFLGMISSLISETPRPVLTNTWGDAIYFVFDEPVSAANVALRLLATLKQGKWRRELTAPLNLRISLHTGPVILCLDPVIRQISFTGSHVSHAARIEPIVREGEVWATEAFVSYAMIDSQKRGSRRRFGFDYLGQIDFAKNYGRYPLFRLSSAITDGADTEP